MNLDRIRTAFDRNRKAVTLRPAMGQGTAVTRVRLDEGLTCHVRDGAWELTSGMSPKAGGAGEAPDPGVFGRAALGSCLAVGFTMWAARAGVPIDSVEVEVHADYDVRGEYGIDDVAPSYSEIRYTITVHSHAPEADIRFVLEKAESVSPYLSMFRDPQNVRGELRVLQGC
jgi:uncharacterized OsmC-like protein